MVIRTADREITTIDYRERAPAASRPDMFLKPDGTVNRELVDSGFLASGVPGTVAGLYLAQTRYGRLKWEDTVKPAIHLAEKGFRVDFDLANAFRKAEKKLCKHPATVKAFFGPGNRVREVGDLLVQPDLAETLKYIRDGGRMGFYGGAVANELVRAIQEGGGIMSQRDLETYTARERKPLRCRYRDVDVLTMGLPSSGGVVLTLMLNMLGGYDLKSMDEGTRAHLLAEVMRRAFKDRALYLGDTTFTSPPLDRLLSVDYAKSLQSGISLVSTTASAALTPDLEIHPSEKSVEEKADNDLGGGQTTHFCVADGAGNVVSNTYTLEQNFGCKAVAGKTGILMNNEMGDFNLRPGWTSEDGAIGTEPNLIGPGKRMLSSMTPVIVLKQGEPYAAFGSPGGRTIINTVLQVLVNLVDLKMTPEAAVKAPRLHHQWFPDKVYVEKTMPWSVTESLKEKGHVLKIKESQGDCHTLFFVSNELGVTIRGIADTRIDGAAAGR
jgi:gamma-glutamyltranspeptidase/glutathione hydrolase